VAQPEGYKAEGAGHRQSRAGGPGETGAGRTGRRKPEAVLKAVDHQIGAVCQDFASGLVVGIEQAAEKHLPVRLAI
jgi:hypothetical protein